MCTKMKKSLRSLVNKNPNDYVEEEIIDDDVDDVNETGDEDSTEKNNEIIKISHGDKLNQYRKFFSPSPAFKNNMLFAT